MMHNGESVRRLLVLSTNEGRRVHLIRVLVRAGYDVHMASSSREATHALGQGGRYERPLPAALLIDIVSVGREARDLIVRAQHAELGVPMIVLGSRGCADDVIACLQAGAVDYVNLPAEPTELLDVLARALAAPMIV